jgi:hypothetical protein
VNAGAFELGAHVRDTHLDHVRHHAALRGLLLSPDVGDDHRAVHTNSHLRPVRLTDTEKLDKPERSGQPSDSRTDVRIHEYWDDGGRREGTIYRHNNNLRHVFKMLTCASTVCA